MTILLCIYLGLSLLVLLIGYLMDRSAIRQRINGANGLPMLAALVLSFAGAVLASGIAVVLAGWGMLIWGLGGAVAYHLVIGWLLINRLQSLATRVAGKPAA